MMPRYDALPPQLAPRGLCREAAAQYVGVSAAKFDQLVDAGDMPGPKTIGSRKVWDREALDVAFVALPDDDGINEWDEAVA